MTGSSSSPTRRKVLLGAGALLAMPAVARAQSKEIVVGTWGGLYEKTLREKVIPAFEAKHDCKVRIETGVGTTFIPKIIASPRSAPYDVIYLNDDEAFLGAGAGLWAADQSAKIPNMRDIYPSMKAPALPMYGGVIYDFPFVYDTRKMSAPTSWNDLWNADITVGIPHAANSYGMTFILIAALLNGGGPDNLSPGFEALKRLRKVKIFKGVTEGFSMFQRGEIDASLFYGHRALQLADQGLPIQRAYPKEGVWGMRAGCQIPAKAKNPELAAAWIDVVMSPEYQNLFADLLYSPSNQSVKLDPALAAKNLYGPEAIARVKFPDWSIINPQRDAIMTRFTKEFSA